MIDATLFLHKKTISGAQESRQCHPHWAVEPGAARGCVPRDGGHRVRGKRQRLRNALDFLDHGGARLSLPPGAAQPLLAFEPFQARRGGYAGAPFLMPPSGWRSRVAHGAARARSGAGPGPAAPPCALRGGRAGAAGGAEGKLEGGEGACKGGRN